METGRLNKYFHSDEFLCKCGCGIFNLDPDFFDKLTEARRIADVPFVINSGCRCPSWNRKKGGTSTSGHVTTDSIRARASDIRAATVEVVVAILRGAILAEIPGIALGLGFVHLDSKARRMIKCYAAFTLTHRGLTIG
jgi:hypothetical protein